MYGQKFKALRLQQHISLEQAANRVISPSTLSRWENNKIDIRFNLVIKLLDNIHINLKEFTNYCKINHSNPFVAKVAMYYEANDDRHILQLIQSKKKEYQNSHNQFDLLLLAIACNCYYDLTDNNVFPVSYQKKLFYILSNIEYWTEMYINVFGNTVFLYDSKELYSISIRILKNLNSNTFNDFQEYYYALSSVINALTALIIKNPKLASQLLTKIEKVSIPKPISYLKIRTNVLKYLLDCRLGKTDEKLISIKLENLKWLGLTDIAKDLTFFFNRIKNDRSPLS